MRRRVYAAGVPAARATIRRWAAWARKLGDSAQVAALSRLGWIFTGLGGVVTWLAGGSAFGLWTMAAGGASLLAAAALMGWRWVSVGDRLARELAYDRRKDAERERSRGLNRLQDRLAASGEPRAQRALAGLRDLGARSLRLGERPGALAPADAEVLAVVERMRTAALGTLERLAGLQGSAAGRGGPGAGEAQAAAAEMLGSVEDAVSRMAVAVGRLEARSLAAPDAGAGGTDGLDALSAELEGAMAVAKRVEERLAEIDGATRTRA